MMRAVRGRRQSSACGARGPPLTSTLDLTHARCASRPCRRVPPLAQGPGTRRACATPGAHSARAGGRHRAFASVIRVPIALAVSLARLPTTSATSLAHLVAPFASSIDMSMSSGANRGSIQFYDDGSQQWRILCDTSQTVLGVACRQLGLAGGAHVSWNYSSYHAGVYLACTGSEARLQDCPVSWTDSCFRAIVSCSDTVHLVGGRTSLEGAVVVRHNGEWGTVCNDTWSAPAATVSCRQIGLPPGSQSGSMPAGAEFVAQSSFHALTGVSCSGWESTLAECSRANSTVSCDAAASAGARCGPQVTIAGGSSEGTAYIAYLGSTYPALIDPSLSSSVQTARVMCRAAGLESWNPTITGSGYSYYYATGIDLRNVACSGTEALLSQCTGFQLSYPYYSSQVYLRCPPGARVCLARFPRGSPRSLDV